MTYRKVLIFVLSMTIVFCVYLCGINYSNRILPIEIIHEKSWFNYYEIKDAKVFINCHILIRNNTKTNKVFFINADFSDDADAGLLTDGSLFATNQEGTIATFEVEGDTTRPLEVIFIGDFGGYREKQNRLLPSLTIVKRINEDGSFEPF